MTTLNNAQDAYVRDIVAGVPFLSFNYNTKEFDVSETISDPTAEQIALLGKATRKLRFNRPPRPALFSIQLDQLNLGYGVRCLEHYCHERLDSQIPHDETCWVQYAHKTRSLGRVLPGDVFDDRVKVQVMEALGREQSGNNISMSIYRAYRKNPDLAKALKPNEDGWIFLHADISIRSLNPAIRLKEAIRDFLKNLLRLPKNDPVLNTVKNIEQHGWQNDLAWQQNVDRPEVQGAILGYSKASQRYYALTGRHRIAAARYLYSRGTLSGSTILEIPVITFPGEPWTRPLPHPDSPICEWCR